MKLTCFEGKNPGSLLIPGSLFFWSNKLLKKRNPDPGSRIRYIVFFGSGFQGCTLPARMHFLHRKVRGTDAC
jgi:hypothetical protein